MSDADAPMFQETSPFPLVPSKDDVQYQDVEWEELRNLAEDYPVHAVPGMLPGLERGHDQPGPKPKPEGSKPTRRSPHGSVNMTKAYAPGRTPKKKSGPRPVPPPPLSVRRRHQIERLLDELFGV